MYFKEDEDDSNDNSKHTNRYHVIVFTGKSVTVITDIAAAIDVDVDVNYGNTTADDDVWESI